MKQKRKIIMSLSAVSVLALTTLGQEASNQPISELYSTNQDLTRAGGDRLNGAAKASDIIGLTVKNYQDVELGKVSDLAVDMESGRIVQVIISSGGFLGLGATLTAVPPTALHQDPELKILQLDVSAEKFKAAPRFDTAKWEECTQSNRLSEAYGYYGQQPYFAREGTESNNADGTFANSLPRILMGQSIPPARAPWIQHTTLLSPARSKKTTAMFPPSTPMALGAALTTRMGMHQNPLGQSWAMFKKPAKLSALR